MTTEKISQIKDRLKAARDRQKRYDDKRRKPLEFSKVSFTIIWAEVGEGKLAPRFVGPFEIIEKKCLADPTLQVPLDEIRVDAKLNFVEEPVEILDREFKKVKRSRIAIVKVRWNSKRCPQFTWECEDQMKLKYDSNVVNENIQENVRNVLVNGNRVGHTAYTDSFHKLARLVPHLVTSESRKIKRYMHGLALYICGMVEATEPKTMQKVVHISGALTDEAVKNGSIKNAKKKGNMREPSKNKNGRDDNKRTRIGYAFATTSNHVGRENT
nr:putative reverse transcriptase domain-containing protein [Tanacetum cinerariifolium]